VATVVGAVAIGLALPAFARYRSEPRATEPAEDSPSSAVAKEA